MKGIPLSDKEYASSQAMLDSFKPENLHKRQAQTTVKNAVRQSRRLKLAQLCEKVGNSTANVKERSK